MPLPLGLKVLLELPRRASPRRRFPNAPLAARAMAAPRTRARNLGREADWENAEGESND